MGAVTFSLDARLLECLTGALPPATFVETGTFKGDAVALAAPLVERVVTVEYSRPLWEEAARRFEGDSRIEVLQGDSPEVLARIRPSLGDAAAIFWLDAHWCVAENTAGDHSQCPLLAEIDAIASLGETSVVLIDDARLFLAPPPEPHDVTQWPTFDQVLLALRRLSDRHELMVVNDVIAFYPPSIRGAVEGYARHHGVDWLRASQALEERTALHAAMEEKEEVIQEQHRSIEALHASRGALSSQVHEKDAAVRTLHDALGHIHVLHAQLAGELKSKDAAIHALDKAVRTLESQHEAIVASLREKEAVIESHSRAIEERDTVLGLLNNAGGSAQAQLLLARGLEEKEAVIQELRNAVEGYRAAFSILRVVLGPLNRVAGAARRAARRAARVPARLLAPRLGNLNQHAPVELKLPPHYARITAPADAPRISLVTPSFRQAHFIERTLASVLDQGYPNLEYHVQDGASDDGTREILERYASRLTSWESRPDSGQTEAINRGFARTTGGEIMGWLNSDDILLPGALAYVADFFARHPEVDVVYGHRLLIDEDGRQIGRWILPAHSDAVLSWADFVPQETLFWRRRIWDKAGGRVDESFRFAMDWDLLVRFRDAGARFVRLPRFLGGFRIHAHQKTSAVISDIGFKEMDRIRERALGRLPTPLEIRKAVLPYLLKHCAADFRWRLRNRLGATS